MEWLDVFEHGSGDDTTQWKRNDVYMLNMDVSFQIMCQLFTSYLSQFRYLLIGSFSDTLYWMEVVESEVHVEITFYFWEIEFVALEPMD